MVTHPCVTRFAGYTVCTTFLSLFLHEPKKNWDQSLNKKHLLLKGCSWLAYDFPNNLHIAVVISRLVLVAGPSFALMNPKYFNTTLFFSSWLVIKFWSLTDFPCTSLQDLDESMDDQQFNFVLSIRNLLLLHLFLYQ